AVAQGPPGLPAMAARARRSISSIHSASVRRSFGTSGSRLASSSATIRARSSGGSFKASPRTLSTVVAIADTPVLKRGLAAVLSTLYHNNRRSGELALVPGREFRLVGRGPFAWTGATVPGSRVARPVVRRQFSPRVSAGLYA